MESHNIRVIEAARASTLPVSVSLSITVLAAAALGMFVGVFAVFFREYWRGEENDYKLCGD